MKMKRTMVMALLLTLALGALTLQAQDTIDLVLQQGVNEYQGTRDTTIYNESTNNGNGGGDYLFAGATGQGAERRALIAFDLSEIPAGATVNSVTLELVVSRTLTGDTEVAAHRLTSDWGEGEENAGGQEGVGANADDGSATWVDNLRNTSSWVTEGGDFEPTASATGTAGDLGSTLTLSGADMVADVQAWLDGDAENFGWILIGVGTAKRFDSANNEASDNRPKLTVTYTQ